MEMLAPISGTLGTGLRPGPRSLGTRAAPILHQSRFRRKRANQRKFGALKHRYEHRLGPSHLADDWLQVAARSPAMSLRAAALISHHPFNATQRNFLALGGLCGGCRLSHLPLCESAKILVTRAAAVGSPSFWPCGRQATIRNFGRAVLYRDDSAVRITERRCPSPRQGTRQLPRIGKGP